MDKLRRRNFIKQASAGMAGLSLAGMALGSPDANSPKAESEHKQPNVLFVLVDDMGWRDSSTYGSNYYETPNVQRLADQGVLFTNAYAANPLCSPTRASILTGQYPARIGFTAPWGHTPVESFEVVLNTSAGSQRKCLEPGSVTRLKNDYYTLGDAFKDAGYSTAFFGKWHMGHPPYIAANQGFDVTSSGGPHPGPPSYFSPWHMEPFHENGPEGEHIDDHITDQAVEFLRANQDRPFYCNLWFYDVHAPYQGKSDLVEKYQSKQMPEDAPQRHPVMGAMIETMDTCLGRVLDELDELGIADNTIVVFFSDNGGVHWVEEEGAPAITSNHPLRGGKGTIYEGGTREPLIVVWPGVAQPGQQTEALVSSVDFYPTLLAAAGIPAPTDHHVDGINFLPVLQGGPSQREVVYGYMPHQVPYPPNTPQSRAGEFLNYPSSYVRVGDWKLIRFHHDGPNQEDRFELFNLRFDMGETTNLADQHPERVAEMDALITAFHEEMGTVLPAPNPAYRDPRYSVYQGWIASSEASFDPEAELMTLVSSGEDPFIRSDIPTGVAQPTSLRWRMKSDLQGDAQVFWAYQHAPGFGPERRTNVTCSPGGEWQTLEVAFEGEGQLTQIRIDPGASPGRVVFEFIELLDADGNVVHRWGND